MLKMRVCVGNRVLHCANRCVHNKEQPVANRHIIRVSVVRAMLPPGRVSAMVQEPEIPLSTRLPLALFVVAPNEYLIEVEKDQCQATKSTEA